MRKQTGRRGRRAWLGAVCAAALALGAGAAPAQGAAGDPLFVFTPTPPPNPPPILIPPPSGEFEGPCGLAVAADGSFYVSDYYHDAIDVFNPSPSYQNQLANEDPLDGPCALALDSTGRLYVNNFHRNVVRFAASPSFGAGTVIAGAPADSSRPTGVAVAFPAGNVYVDERTYVAVYGPTGAPVEVGGVPLRIGSLDNLGDGYGLAISRFSATLGRLYVPDAADNTVKVYDPALDTENPVATIHGPGAGFTSLRDSAVAVDRVSGDVYVADNVGSSYTEHPETTIDVFSSTGAYEGHLKYNVLGAGPVGLAVDNSTAATQGRVYVTSGNTDQASVYAYPPGAAVTAPPVCAPGGACPSQTGAAAPLAAPRPLAVAASQADPPPARRGEARAASAAVTQKGTLRVTVTGKLSPRSLPRSAAAPISVSVGGKVETTDQSFPPQLKTLQIEINRHGRLDYTGLPTCPYNRIQPASSSRALSACRSALVGKGSFTANITLAGQEPYPTQGHLLVFNGKSHGRPVLFGQIYSPHPFATSFVIVFAVQRLARGAYGTALSASLPKALGSWGNLTGIEMTLSRRYAYRGESRSYLSAACPAPKGFHGAAFPLARTSFGFAGGKNLTSILTDTCRVR